MSYQRHVSTVLFDGLEIIPSSKLSCRYKVEDIFWFSFFHEVGHVLLHGKRDVFLEDDKRQAKRKAG